ncbi:MAG: right-handed parallel beta-helix repeat-containing protein [Planctomycetota bacterium]
MSFASASSLSAQERELPLWADRMDRVTAGAKESALADELIRKTVHVRADARTDGDGTAARPFASVRAGFEAAKRSLAKGTATKLKIGPGVYRESMGRMDVTVGEIREALFIIEGAGAEKTIITGADLVEADAWESVGNGVYAMEWNLDLSHVSPSFGPPGYLGHRSEMLFVDGKLLRQVLIEPWTVERQGKLRVGTKTQMVYTEHPVLDPREVLEPGTFGVAELDSSGRWANKLFVKPGHPDDLKSKRVEVARRGSLLRIDGGKENLVLRGLTFTQACSQRQTGVIGPVFIRGHMRNILIDDCAFTWNNFTGLRLRLIDKLTIRNSRFDYNGDGGLNLGHNRYTLFENNSTSFNNWRGHWGNYYGWSMGGIKFHETEFNILRNHVAVGNMSPGIWYDIQCEHIYVDNLVSAFNRLALFFEIGNGPHVVDRSILAHGEESAYRAMIVGPTLMRDTIVYSNAKPKADDANKKHAAIAITYYGRQHSWHRTQRLVRPGLYLHQDNVFMAGPNQGALIRLAPGEGVDEHSYAFRYVGEGNLHWHARSGSGRPVYQHQVTTPGKPWTITSGGGDRFSRWADRTDARVADPGFADPDLLDFTVDSRSPAASNPRLPLRQIDRRWIDQTREFYAWARFPLFADILGDPTE